MHPPTRNDIPYLIGAVNIPRPCSTAYLRRTMPPQYRAAGICCIRKPQEIHDRRTTHYDQQQCQNGSLLQILAEGLPEDPRDAMLKSLPPMLQGDVCQCHQCGTYCDDRHTAQNKENICQNERREFLTNPHKWAIIVKKTGLPLHILLIFQQRFHWRTLSTIQFHPQQFCKGGAFIHDFAARQHHIRLDIRPLCEEHRLGSIRRKIAMGGMAHAVIL